MPGDRARAHVGPVDLPVGAPPRRSRWWSYLLLARVSNLPTVWTNVLAGIVVSGVPVSIAPYLQLCLAVSLLYVGGMVLNDVFDRHVDARTQPTRPLPSGRVGWREASLAGSVLLAAGVLVVALLNPAALWWGVALAAAILYYDYRHKRDPFAPAVMGLCRGLVYCLAAATVAQVDARVAMAALVLASYVAGLTWMGRSWRQHVGPWIPYLIAGISLLDAAIIATLAPLPLALAAATGFVVTVALQRVIPGD